MKSSKKLVVIDSYTRLVICAVHCLTCRWTAEPNESNRTKARAEARNHALKHPGHKAVIDSDHSTFYESI